MKILPLLDQVRHDVVMQCWCIHNLVIPAPHWFPDGKGKSWDEMWIVDEDTDDEAMLGF